MYRILHESRAKVEWAKKHIRDLYALTNAVPAQPHFYSVSLKKSDPQRPADFLNIAIHKGALAEQVALYTGDALHNLRSSLDILFCRVVKWCGGQDTPWTHFPIRDGREQVCERLDKTLKKKQISTAVRDFILNTIKPYKAGNFSLWALHELNMMDKHQLLIPTFGLVRISGIRLRNEKDEIIEVPPIYTESTFDSRLDENWGWNLTLENQGSAQVAVIFDLRTPYPAEPVIMALDAITKEVSRAIEAFELLLASG